MILKNWINALKKVNNTNLNILRHSALFINGAKATENYIFVTPHIDFPENFKNKESIEEQLKKRKVNIDITPFEDLWSVYEDLKAKKSELESKKNEISKELSKLIKAESESDECQKLKVQLSLLKDNIKKLKEPLWSAEEMAIIAVLKLPNNLHPKTESSDKILYSHLKQPNNNKDHMNICNELKLIEFRNNNCYYLKGEASIFELGAQFYFSKLLKKNNFTQFSNPDFVKSAIIEGACRDHTSSKESFILNHNEDTKVNNNSRLHLTGGGSLCSFLAYHTNNVVYPKTFPLKYFTCGRQFLPSLSNEHSLLNVSQSSVIQLFHVSKTNKELDSSLWELVEFLKELYSKLFYHYKITVLSADKLSMWESLRVVVEMYSSSLQKYIEVANLSVSGDFLSKRLMFTYIENKQNKFPHLISGTILNVPKLLACILEQDQDFKIPEEFTFKNWNV